MRTIDEGPSLDDLNRLASDRGSCPSCGEDVYDQAVFCPHCGEMIEGDVRSSRTQHSRGAPDRRATVAILLVFMLLLLVIIWGW